MTTDEIRELETTHTPGPWSLTHSGYANAPYVLHVGNVDPNYNRRYPLHGVDWIAEIRDDESEDHPRYEANARLIASAPELLEALKALEEQVADLRAGRTWDADYIGVKKAHLKAKAAIRKATGAA